MSILYKFSIKFEFNKKDGDVWTWFIKARSKDWNKNWLRSRLISIKHHLWWWYYAYKRYEEKLFHNIRLSNPPPLAVFMVYFWLYVWSWAWKTNCFSFNRNKLTFVSWLKIIFLHCFSYFFKAVFDKLQFGTMHTLLYVFSLKMDLSVILRMTLFIHYYAFNCSVILTWSLVLTWSSLVKENFSLRFLESIFFYSWSHIWKLSSIFKLFFCLYCWKNFLWGNIELIWKYCWLIICYCALLNLCNSVLLQTLPLFIPFNINYVRKAIICWEITHIFTKKMTHCLNYFFNW